MILDPPVGAAPNPNFEVVHLTAYTSGQLTGTIQRAQEGTTAHGHNVNAIWAVGPTAGDYLGEAPVGSIVPYVGQGDPPETNWVIADGRLIDRTVNADFFARAGHAYNLGIDPGNNKVKIPDKRGKHPLGAINMGSAAGAGTNDNAHATTDPVSGSTVVVGSKGGEVKHLLANAEMPSHSHGANTGTMSQNSVHGHTDNGHGHGLTSGESVVSHNVGFSKWGATGQNQNGSVLVACNGQPVLGDISSGSASLTTTNIDHSHAISPDGGVNSHANVAPYEADSYIVRVA